MSFKETGGATDLREIDRYDHGVGWIAYPNERMQRASHALEVDGKVWVVDPVDAEGLDHLLDDLGEVAGVVILLDRHKRDAAAVARRHDVAVHVPSFMAGDVADDLDAPVERFHRELDKTGFGAHTLVDNFAWKEAALYNDETGVLVVPESVGTGDYFLAGEERLGVHPMLRLKPPRKLSRFDPERILVGHGEGIHEDATGALETAIAGSRRRTPEMVLKTIRSVLPV